MAEIIRQIRSHGVTIIMIEHIMQAVMSFSQRVVCLDAGRIIACEVITPAGNWSSWPPHKHDTERPGIEAELEEIYWFETRTIDARGADPVGYQRVYGTDERPIDVLAEVRTDRVVIDTQGATWVRETWPELATDPRLPLAPPLP